MEQRDSGGAFKWIVEILNRHNIPFQISGGFAARLYGSTRELADIDIGVPDDAIDTILNEVSLYIISGPKHYVDDEWDLKLITLKYKNQEIDICGRDSIKIFDKENKIWIPAHRDMTVSEDRIVYGMTVPVIPKQALINYKKKINREVDILDVKAMES